GCCTTLRTSPVLFGVAVNEFQSNIVEPMTGPRADVAATPQSVRHMVASATNRSLRVIIAPRSLLIEYSPYHQLPAKPDVLRRRAAQHAEGARLDDPLHVAVEHLQLIPAEGEAHGLRFSRGQRDPFKPLQLDDRPCDGGEHVADIELRHFVAGA